MRGVIKRSLLIIMILGIMGCGQQVEQPGKQNGAGSGLSGAMMEVGRSAENAFYAFLELVSDVLGFTAKSTTKKNDVGLYFGNLGAQLGNASKELEELSKKAGTGGDKSDSLKNIIKEAVEAANEVLGTLKRHLELLGQVGDDKVVGDAASGGANAGVAAAETELKKAYNALKEIVKASKYAGVKELESGATTLQASGGVDNKDGAKILATNSTGGNPGATDASKATGILATVSGEEMLASIVKSQEGDKALSNNADANTSAISFARGGQADHLAHTKDSKAAAVAGGIVLRSLLKTSKLASGAADNATGGGKEVQGIGVAAANKLLVAVEDIIKKTVKNVLEKAKGKIDEARSGKGIANSGKKE
ncbi:variable large family protein [Borrelia persica]|uniref:variable large family protein n=1 Tax=Borrelia persica TaxID=44448 RepID=UPI0005716878|nr:variable large family protein [Borrelia persica]